MTLPPKSGSGSFSRTFLISCSVAVSNDELDWCVMRPDGCTSRSISRKKAHFLEDPSISIDVPTVAI